MALFKLGNVEDFYELGEVLGSGHFGQVRRVCERATGQHYAAKFLKVFKSTRSLHGLDRSQVEREVNILQTLKHPNIVALKDLFESRVEVALILELVSGGELFDFIAEKDELLESEAILFMRQILQGLSYMHQQHVAHFDLKPENMMLSEKVLEPNIKLIDFGLAQRLEPGQEYRSTSGTPQYIAPEVIKYEPLTTATDMWSTGVITYILLSGLSPFQGDTDEETLNNVIELKYVFEEGPFRNTSDMAKDFIQKLLVNSAGERMTADECLLHPWIKPITRKQVDKRNRSSINMKNFKRFNAKRKWKMSLNMVWMCTRLLSLRQRKKTSAEPNPLQRECDSDVEDMEVKPGSLLRRRLSSST
ncbi:death-associated protein kinase 2 [Periophthalmus magnuspinnatus]|uniref:death-associated protein kinase 2 n=1 Tax=Periophthalmus magnuspinnatus TaxID=409849 RepID=UPI00145ACA11|nr:death-associated protein kinase 2 [Periophthalmus magnuspinnatus]